MLSLNEETHEYTFDGVKVPGVSEVIQSTCLFNGDFYEEEGRMRGVRVHEKLERFDNGESYEVEEDGGYIEAYKKFLGDTVVEILEVEAQKFNPKYKYAGKIDRFILFDNKKAILDIKTIKTGSPPIWVRLQTAAYADFYGDVLRLVLVLRENGTYSLVEHKNRLDFNMFLYALNLLNFKNGGHYAS